LLFISLFKSFDKFVKCVVYDAKIQLYFYIASDILKKIEKKPQPEGYGLVIG